MTFETLEGTIDTVHKRKLEDLGIKPLEYKGDVELYSTIDEVKAKNDMPSDEEVISFRNTQRKNAKRQKLMADRTEEAAKKWNEENSTTDAEGKVTVKPGNPFEKPTLTTSEELRYKNIYDALIAAKKTPEEADRIAKAALA